MARIIVTTDPTTDNAAPVLLLDERVCSIQLGNDDDAAQLIERVGWAISDAETTQRAEPALEQ